jgi:hypothetical protein
MRDAIAIRIFKQACTQDLAVWMQRRGWLLSVLSLEGRMMWLQATKHGRRIEADIRGLGDVANACDIIKSKAQKIEDWAAKNAA